jgi:D-alanyl-D-alanine carboxypeptidase (penicillin-binding protein 5/6)
MEEEHTTHEQHAQEEQPTPNTLPVAPQLAIAALILVLVFGASYIPTLGKQNPNVQPTSLEAQVVTQLEKKEYKNFFEDVSIDAHAAYVWDVKTQKALYNKNASAQLPLASLTKLMTLLVASENLEDNDIISISQAAILQDGESQFRVGERFSYAALRDLTLLTSSNDGAFALAAAAGASMQDANQTSTDAFIREMNTRAEEIGLSQTYFNNPTGLDINDIESGSYGSARDMAFLMEYIIQNHPDLLTMSRESGDIISNTDGATFNAANTNHVTYEIPGLIGSKTGYTTLAGGNLVIAFDAGLNHPVIVAVLGSTRAGRFEDVLDLTDRARKTITQ